MLLGGAQLATLLACFAPLWVASAVVAATALFVVVAGPRVRLGLYGPAVTKGARDAPGAAVVFAVPARQARSLVAALAPYDLRAAFVVGADEIAASPSILDELRAAGHELVAGPSDGRPLPLFASNVTVRARVLATFRAWERIGFPGPRAFLPLRGRTHPAVRGALLELGAFLLAPRRRWSGQGPLPLLAPGDVLLVDGDGPSATEVAAALAASPVPIAKLSAVLRRPVLGAPPAGAVAGFYDGLAASYDAEQDGRGAASVRSAERRAITARLSALVRPGMRVLELGAGTGRFTELLAELGAEVTAVELSSEMAARLRERLARRGHDRVAVIVGDLLEAEVGGDHELVCSFSCFEYVADLDRLLAAIAARLAPGGVLYFTTARRGLFRWFVQLGNALRQGLWLTARSDREVRAALARGGFASVRVASHGLRCGPLGGMLLEVEARRSGER